MGFYQFFIILICNIFLLFLNVLTAEAQVINTSYEGPASVEESHQFLITCQTNLYANIKWKINGTTIDFDTRSDYKHTEDRNDTARVKFSSITVVSALPKHTGYYKCSHEADDYGHNVTVIVGIKLKLQFPNNQCRSESKPVDFTKCVVGKPYDKFSIQCKPDSSLNDTLTVAWYKSEKESMSKSKGKLLQSSDRIHITDDAIEFIPLVPDDLGIYRCQVVTKGQENEGVTPYAEDYVEVQVLPWVKKTHKDVTAIEEHGINLTCTVMSAVPSKVSWIVINGEGNKTYDDSKGRIVLSNINDTTNNQLFIKSANITLDRGNYTCKAESEVGSGVSDMTFYIRVKSKYAALWPFLGICAEVIILCTIILIYEKKRDKTELEESDTDQGPETKSSPDHGQDSIRYRK